MGCHPIYDCDCKKDPDTGSKIHDNKCQYRLTGFNCTGPNNPVRFDRVHSVRRITPSFKPRRQ